MERELKRLKAADAKHGLKFADKAENLALKFEAQQRENIELLFEIDGIPRKREVYKDIPILGSGGLYLNFGNNTVQEKINKAALCIVKKC